MTTPTRLITYQALLSVLTTRDLPELPEPLWNEFLDVAELHRVLPFVAECVWLHYAILPVAVQQRVAVIVRECRQNAFWFSAELKGLLAALAGAAIDVVPLKGPYYSERIYGGTHLRATRDLDLLVRRSQLADARHLLRELHFTLHRVDCEYHETWTRASTVLELHWNVAEPALFDFDIDSAWQRASPDDFSGEPLLRFDPMDELLFICLHGTRHGFETLGLVLDIALLLEHIAINEAAGALQLRPQVKHLCGVLALGCELAQHLRNGKALPFTAAWRAQEYRGVSSMAEKHWRQLSTGCSTQKRWPQLRKLYRSTLRTRHARTLRFLHDLRDGFKLLLDGDDLWAQKIGAEYRISWLIRLLRL